MVHRHGAILGLAELARVVGRDGFATLAIEILRLPVSFALLLVAFIVGGSIGPTSLVYAELYSHSPSCLISRG